jgi:hypothetical protein
MPSDTTVEHEIFEVGDTVTWRRGWYPRSWMGSSGPGPFVVQYVDDMEVDCLCDGHPHHYPATPECPKKSIASHPQMVTIGDPDSGEFLNCIGGGHLTKVAPV